MKLRNKKTGEIMDLSEGLIRDTQYGGLIEIKPVAISSKVYLYCSLAELNAEWEDYRPAEKKPRRYRLIKDLPTFNKGDEFYIAQTGALWYDGGGDDDVCAYATQTLMKFPNILEEWFEPIEPAEPLIKDEKIRKAVRAWAEANDFTNEIEVRSLNAGTRFSEGHWSIEFIGYFIYDLKIGSTYTIAELCGEGEE